MKKYVRFLAAALCPVLCLSMAACDGEKPQPSASQGTDRVSYVGQTYVQYPEVRDYTYSWWPNGTGRSYSHNFCVQTGYYGISVNSVTGMPTRIGAIAQQYSQTAASTANEDVINALTAVTAECSFTADKRYVYTNIIEPAPYCTSSIRMIESGQYMQSFDAAAMTFADASGTVSEIIGRTEIKATPKYFALNFQLFSQTEVSGAALTYSLAFSQGMSASVSDGGAHAVISGSDGGFCVIMPEGSLAWENNTLTMNWTGTLEKQTFCGLSAIIIPSVSPSQEDIDYYRSVSSLQFDAVQIEPREGKEVPVSFDASRGVWEVDTNKMITVSGSQFVKEENRNLADRLTFTVTNPTDRTVRVPIVFKKKNNFAVEGFGPMLRDAQTGEPLGVPIQISKNWHAFDNSVRKSEWYKGLDGKWFNGYTYLEIPAGKSVTYEYMNAYNNYGTVNVASHSQLCLIGWPAYSTHQIWHTSTIGSSGEAFCYDPDNTCGYGFINDVRGVGFDPFENGGQYVWGANNGGGNFLLYGKDGRNKPDSNETVGYKNVKVFYRNYAPNLAEVIFTGVTADNAVQFTFTTYLGRTNDVSRATHTFEYKFLKDVTFERMAFYQLGGDRHNSGRWHGITIGNNEGPIEYTIDGVTYGAEAEIPVGETAGYVGGNGMQRIEVPGEGLWAAFTDSYIGINSDYFQSKNAARMMSLLYFDADINGQHYDKPAVNLRSTEMFCGNSTIVELCPPASVGNTVKAGSVVRGGVEYINLPVSLESVYYDSPVLKSFPAEEFDTWRLAYRYAMGDKTSVTAETGEVLRQYPIAVKCAGSTDVLAQITVKGGISYIPLTFTNVPIYSGYRLEKLEGDAWVRIDQSVKGNDYWQAYYDAEAGSYELTFNVEHSGDPDAQYTYRLVKE
ncbi:MAG: hypothetical protein PUC05_05855 [Firmicutes bacterium]|nr:hypothetical protein [Bacillota bacterium]